MTVCLVLHVALAVVKTAHQRELPKPVMIPVQNSTEKPHRRKPKFLLSGMLQQVLLKHTNSTCSNRYYSNILPVHAPTGTTQA